MRHLKFLCTCVILLLTSVTVFAQTQITGHVADMKGKEKLSLELMSPLKEPQMGLSQILTVTLHSM